MPLVQKSGTYEAQWAAPDEYVVNERTGPRGKCMAGKIRITCLETGARWYIEPGDFHDSGWRPVNERDRLYFAEQPKGAAA